MEKKTAKNKTALKGRDIMAPVDQITLDGQAYKLKFDNQCFRNAEDVYEAVYGRDVGYAQILQEIGRGKYRAIQALFFAAMASAGSEMAWEEFDQKFKLDSIEGIGDIIAQNLEKSLPEPEGDETP